MKALDKKLLRDILHWRGQIIAIVLVVACGIASFVSMLSAYESLQLSQATYYNNFGSNSCRVYLGVWFMCFDV